MSRSLNKVQLIGNLTRDPELRYTPQGTAVCTFSVATNRQWRTESGEMRDEAEFHRIVAWDKLAEICANMLKKGRKVFVEGRIQTRKWTGQDGQARITTEVVISDMLLLDRTAPGESQQHQEEDIDIPVDFEQEVAPAAKKPPAQKQTKPSSKPKPAKKVAKASKNANNNNDDDIPF
jgi:single-strand DNA-binding protein